ncbi:MAG: alpha/beta hydrolase [Rhodospirillales bacterium]|nr:alpha/beta hydrolase [Rhodospirillales bacterium]
MSQRIYRVLDRPEVVSVLFYPRRDVGVPRLAPGVHSVRIPVEDGVHLGGKIFVAEARAPVILYFHGNGEIASDYDTIAPFYTRLGITLFVVDYRGYGVSGGAPNGTSLIDDAWSVYAQAQGVLAENGITTDQFYVMGRSLGSAAALEIVHRAEMSKANSIASNTESSLPNIAGLIIESGFAYTFPLIERIGFLQLADSYEHKDGFGNLDKIASARLPTLIIHGERDWIIPIGDAEALHEASPSTNKTLLRIPSAGHNDLMLVGRQAYFDAVALFCGRSPTTSDDSPTTAD